MAEQDSITLSRMRFHVLIGILPHEREHRQPLEVDLTVWMGAGHAGVVDYRALHDGAREVVEAESREYLEEVADAVAQRALSVAGVARARVTVRKPQVPLGAPLDYVEVTVHRPSDA